MTAVAFQQNLAFGQQAESAIARWLRAKGRYVLPVYDIEYVTGKGPRLFSPTGQIIAPDLVSIRGGKVAWVEAKHKTVFSWYRKAGCWETGIDLRHYLDYLRVAQECSLPVWLLFLHRSAVPSVEDRRWGCPPECPTGLYGQEIAVLRISESHRSDRHGATGMVYWAAESLLRLATLRAMGIDPSA
jgi:hypothetical protein